MDPAVSLSKSMPGYLIQWEKIAKLGANPEGLDAHIKEKAENFFQELNQSFDEWSSLSPRSTEKLERLVSVIYASCNEAPLYTLLVQLIEKGSEEKAIALLSVLKVKGIPLAPKLLLLAYKNKLVNLALEIIGDIPGRFLKHIFENGQTQLHLACQYDMLPVLEQLWKCNIDYQEKQDSLGNTALHYACASGNIQILNQLFEYGHASVIVNCKNLKNQTALHMCAGTKEPSFIRVLISDDYRADLFILDNDHCMPFHCACKVGDIEIAKAFYLAMTRQDKIKTNKALPYALFLASQEGHQAIIKLLIDEYQVDVNNIGFHPLIASLKSQKQSVAIYFIHHDRINLDIRNNNTNVFLKLACQMKASDEIFLALFRKITLTQEDLYCLCVYKKIALVQLDVQDIAWDAVDRLIDNAPFEKNQDSQEIKKPRFSQSLLHLASLHNYFLFLKYLLEVKGARVDVKNSDQETPLLIAVAHPNLEVVIELIAAKANIHAVNKYGTTPLHRASARDQRAIMDYLISHGASMELRNIEGQRPLDRALNESSFSSALFLVWKGSLLDVTLLPESNAVKFLMYVCGEKIEATDEMRQAVVKSILKTRPNLFSRVYLKMWELVNIVSRNGNYLVLQAFIDHFSDRRQLKTEENGLNLSTSSMSTSLSSSFFGLTSSLFGVSSKIDAVKDVDQPAIQTRTLKELLNKPDSEGNTSLHLACMSRSTPCVLLLIDFEADILQANKNGETAIDLMVQFGLITILQELWHNKQIIPSDIKSHECLLFLICQGGNAEIGLPLIKDMQQASKDLSIPPFKDGQTFLHVACQYKNHDLAKILLQAEVNITSQDCFGQQPLHWAIASQMEEIALEITQRIDNCSDLDKPDRQGRTPLHLACRNKLLRLVEMLTAKGVNVNASDATGRSPLHEAFDAKEPNIAQALIHNGANPDAIDLGGYTPIILAVENGFPHLAFLLVELTDDPIGSQRNTRLGYSLFQLACEKEYWGLACLLFEKEGALNHLRPASLRSEFCHYARRKGNELLKSKIDVNELKSIKNNTTPLHKSLSKLNLQNSSLSSSSSGISLSASSGKELSSLDVDLQTVTHFIEKREYLNTRDYRNRLPIHIACIHDLAEPFKSLLSLCENDPTLSFDNFIILSQELALYALRGRSEKVVNAVINMESFSKKMLFIKELFEVTRDFLKQNTASLAEFVSFLNLPYSKGLLNQLPKLRILCQDNLEQALQSDISSGCKDEVFSDSLKNQIGKNQETFLDLMYERNRTKDLSYFKGTKLLTQFREKADLLSNIITSGNFEIVPLVFGLKLLDPEIAHSSLMPCWRSPIILSKLEMFKKLGVDLMKQDRQGNAPLHWACRNPHHAAVVSELLKSEDVNQKNHRGNTPLHIACSQRALPELVLCLINAGADLASKNLAGNTPLHLACMNNDPVLAALLLQQYQEKDKRDVPMIRNSKGEWANLSLLCKKPYAQELHAGERSFLTNLLVLTSRSSYFHDGLQLPSDKSLSSILLPIAMPVEFIDKVLLFFHSGVLEVDKAKWLDFFKEIVYFANEELDSACKKWLEDNFNTLTNISEVKAEAIDFFTTLGTSWEMEINLLLDDK
ncbi:MAG: ankyrin repeat domain-containing protein [Parachlamydiaceae bacterium]|nr:ankyrin repeat domain-containing protein [Parachlamydiaceae bacterium]